ncbi:MAG: transposase [Cyanobacteria bacterium P01_G01_bin.54]
MEISRYGNPDLKISQRRLPHWELPGSIYFITFITWDRLELSPPARDIVLSACRYFDGDRYTLYAAVVMPDHVHLLLQPQPQANGEPWPLSKIIHSLKSYTAKQISTVMMHHGTLWMPERYDRIIRDAAEFQATWQYIQENPLRSGLCTQQEDYPFVWQRQD